MSRNDRLMVYRHRVTGRFVMGAWVWSPKEATVPVVSELEGFDSSPGLMWPRGLLVPEVMMHRLRPAQDDLQKRRRKVADRKSEERRLREENGRERQIAARRLKKMGLEREAHKMAVGATPFSGKAQSKGNTEMWADEIKKMLRRS